MENKLATELAFQNEEREQRAAELAVANAELLVLNQEKEKRAAELVAANAQLKHQNEEKEKRAEELAIANTELAFQNKEKVKRAEELAQVNKELVFHFKEKEKRAAELAAANRELAFQNSEKEQRAAELAVANTELTFQNIEKEKRAAELMIANSELAFQNNEKRERAAELVIANKELTFQNLEKEKRAAELMEANAKLAFLNNEKEKRASELMIANRELAFQNEEKEKRAAELIAANDALAFEINERERRAAELAIVMNELAFQNEEKEKRAAELTAMNKELESFTFISSHDLQEPLRKIQIFASRILSNDYDNLSETGKNFFDRMQLSALHMQNLINDLLAYSRTTAIEGKFELCELETIVDEVRKEFHEELHELGAVIKTGKLGTVNIIPFQFRQLLHNLVSNSLKFIVPGKAPEIMIECKEIVAGPESGQNLLVGEKYTHITVSDNGIGFSASHSEKIFEIFQRLNSKEEYEGTGMGLTIARKITDNHKGVILATSELNQGATFHIFLPS